MPGWVSASRILVARTDHNRGRTADAQGRPIKVRENVLRSIRSLYGYRLYLPGLVRAPQFHGFRKVGIDAWMHSEALGLKLEVKEPAVLWVKNLRLSRFHNSSGMVPSIGSSVANSVQGFARRLPRAKAARSSHAHPLVVWELE